MSAAKTGTPLLESCSASSCSVLVLPVSVAPATIPVPPFGTLGIDPRFAVPLPPIALSPSTGVGSAVFDVIDDPSLLGISIWAQALFEEPTGSRLSNVTRDVTWR